MKHIFPIALSTSLALAISISPGMHPVAFAGPADPLSTQIDIVGPSGSESFGRWVTVLPNGNIVVNDPYYDAGGSESEADVGAVYLYSGSSGALISMLTGSTAHDYVGYVVVALANGNYVVISPFWDNGAEANAGAVTWCSGTTGCTGVVSSTNSLVGSLADDLVGFESSVEPLSNGNYVVSSGAWDNGAVVDAGAVTWCSGTTGCTGVVSSTNSLVGSSVDDWVGYVEALTNGNYVVSSSAWDDDAVADVGAVTWCSGTAGCTGVVSSTNSLVGSSVDDRVGSVTALTNGNYVVRSFFWDNGAEADAGAVTWCSGTTGCPGMVSAANSLVGSTAGDWVGLSVVPLSNGHYVVSSPYWDDGAVVDTGAVTWGNGTTGCTGVVSSTNSLVGSSADDRVGYNVTTLTNGNYVVGSSAWDSGAVADAGAATWCSGTAGCTGVVSSTNSLVGSSSDDRVGSVTALSNGHYVVRSPNWDNGTVANVGAVTWCSGTAGCTGVVSSTNSLMGPTTDNRVGFGVTALTNGHYVVHSPYWDNGAVVDTGAVTWGNGTMSTSGVVSSTNSLIGSTADNRVGYDVAALSNGHYVVSSPYWDDGAVVDTGAVTWGNGTMSTSGVVSSTNSLVGSLANDQVGDSVTTLDDGSYVVHSPLWNGTGAITWCIGLMGCTGPITAENSVLGTAEGAWDSMTFAYDPVNLQLVVGRPADNTVTLLRPYQRVFLPLVLR
jgi:hypothetical protein